MFVWGKEMERMEDKLGPSNRDFYDELSPTGQLATFRL